MIDSFPWSVSSTYLAPQLVVDGTMLELGEMRPGISVAHYRITSKLGAGAW